MMEEAGVVKDRRATLVRRIGRASAFLAATLGASLASADEGRPIGLAEAAERGAFNVGDARGNVGLVADPEAGGDVLKLDYSLPPGTAVGVWTKGFPAGLAPGSVDVVRASARAGDRLAMNEVTAALEIKGTAGTQTIPLEAHEGWSARAHLLDWAAIGTPREVVVSVKPRGGNRPVTGTLSFDVRFEPLTPLRKLSLSLPARFVGVALAGLLVAAIEVLVRLATSRPEGERPRGEARPGAWLHDLVHGVGVVALACLALAIDHVGGLDRLDVGWWPVWLALAGWVLGAWWKFGLTGEHLTPGEALRDALASGLLAGSVAPISILQAPASWSDLLLLSQPVAAAVAVLYHGANAVRLASSGRRLGAIGGAMIVGTPYAVGWLLLLEATGLVRALGNVLSFGLLSHRPLAEESIGRVAVLFGFNEVVANALCLATRRTLLRRVRAHPILLIVAACTVGGWWMASSVGAADLPDMARIVLVLMATVCSQGFLWAEAYLLTGMVTDAIHRIPPTFESMRDQIVVGFRKGAVYSGTFLGILSLIGLLVGIGEVREFGFEHPMVLALVVGALAFPMVKTIIETFDGSQAFFRRVRTSYRKPMLYARGAVVGLGLGYALGAGMPGASMGARVQLGFVIGLLAYAGVNFLGDAIASLSDRGRVQSWRVYLVQGMLGGAIGAALGFYLDAAQVGIIVAKFHRYVDPGQAARLYEVRPFLSQWGLIRLGNEAGGPSLLFAEALAGVISWSIPSWLFAINRTFMAAYFDRDAAPIRALFTRAGMVQLVENMIGVLRWGLWMSPIINSFLRPMGEPTWYNQDGAIHTVVAIGYDLTSTRSAFRIWSLDVFIALLAYDWVRILIWVDHMGLRVATLVNLSFLGMDRLDRRLARFLAPASTARCVPEAVKRFTTWAPLLIPYYIPRGNDWDIAWARGQALRAGSHGGVLATIVTLPTVEQGALVAGSLLATTAAFSAVRLWRARAALRRRVTLALENAAYEVTVRDDGAVASRVKGREYDVTRRSYDLLDPAGRALFVVEGEGEMDRRAWPVIGNVARGRGAPQRIERDRKGLKIIDQCDDLRVSVTIALPDPDDAAEVWTVSIENPTDSSRRVKVVPYVEWVLNRADADRGHTQYNRLFAEVEYASGLHGVLAWDKHAKAMGVLAADVAPEGFLSTRVDFLGRARGLGSSRVLETLAFSAPRDTDGHPTFDPIGSLLLGVTVPPRGSSQIRLLIGLAADKAGAIDLVARHLLIPLAGVVPPTQRRKTSHSIGHGEIPDGTPATYAEFSDDGRRMTVRTPFTPRPFDHTMSNALGHVVVVTNRGLHTTSSVNAQQNRVTPDWSDTVTREVPGEAFYLYDPDSREWFSPTYHPMDDPDAAHEAEFGVDGTATFRMTRGTLETELTVFVPPDEPAGVYRLTIRNESDASRRLRVAPYFQIVLAGQPEYAGPLAVRSDLALHAIFFENPRNTFRDGPAFVAMSGDARFVVTNRGRFFGDGRGSDRPILVERGESDPPPSRDDRPIAAFLAEIEIPARGERTVIVVLGQADDRARAEAVIRKYRDPEAVDRGLQATRRWWTSLMDTVRVETSSPEFDRYLDWLKYQALAERIWARRGFYQASGAFGFRDQLQDSINLLWMDPVLARRQIVLHASQQFPEGDVVHWFHRLQDGRTGFVGRTHASDNLLWLCWAVVEYLAATGDETLLDERTSYIESDLPFEPLPAGKGGMGFDPLRSSREDTVYRHCLRAIDLVLDRRMGVHGLPLMGTGDWNDGLDEIGSEGKGESVWLGLFLHYILARMLDVIGRKDGSLRDRYAARLRDLTAAIESSWRGDRYLRAFHDDGTEIGVKGSGVWEIDALTAAWAVMAGINPERGRIVFETALATLEREKTILLGWPPLREDTHPYLGRSSAYPEGVRENGMYCHGVQWLVGAARILAEQADREGRGDEARHYRETAYRLWLKTSSIPHAVPGEIETFGGQPNQQAADMVTTFDPGRMIWNGYTGAAGWMFRQALEGVLGLRLVEGMIVPPADFAPAGDLSPVQVGRDVSRSPFEGPVVLRPPAQSVSPEHADRLT